MNDKKDAEKGEEVEFLPEEDGDAVDLAAKIKKLTAQLRQCGEERKEYLEGWQRAKADYINYRKDEGKRFEDMARFVTAGLIQEILPVLDSFSLALSHGLAPEEQKGVLLIRSQLMDILKKRGVEELVVRVGDTFSPEKHESVGEIESELPAEVIAQELQKGYMFNGRVLRPARVRIAKAKTE
jgi:molecular chaperone GrpE